MNSPRIPASRRLAVVPLALVALLVLACDSDSSSYRSPTAPAGPTPAPPPPSVAPTPAPSSVISNFWGDATILSVAGERPDCGYYLPVSGPWDWQLWLEGERFTLFEGWDPEESPVFTGKLQGLSFAAHPTDFPSAGHGTCFFREAAISGSFSEGFESFEARETLIWGPPENELRVELAWRAHRR